MTSTDPTAGGAMLPGHDERPTPNGSKVGGRPPEQGAAMTNGNACPALTAAGRFATVPTELLAAAADGRASARAVQLYAVLARHAGPDGRCWPSARHLAADAGCSVRAVWRALGELRALGLVDVVETRATTAGRVNVYALGGRATGGATPVDNHDHVEGGRATGGTTRRATGGTLNESQGNETHQGVVEQLLDQLPPRIARRVERPDRLRPLLARTGRHRSVRAVARHLAGDGWPPLDEARSVEAALLHRLTVLADQLDQLHVRDDDRCHRCDTADLELLDDGTVVKACDDHRPLQLVEAVAA